MESDRMSSRRAGVRDVRQRNGARGLRAPGWRIAPDDPDWIQHQWNTRCISSGYGIGLDRTVVPPHA